MNSMPCVDAILNELRIIEVAWNGVIFWCYIWSCLFCFCPVFHCFQNEDTGLDSMNSHQHLSEFPSLANVYKISW